MPKLFSDHLTNLSVLHISSHSLNCHLICLPKTNVSLLPFFLQVLGAFPNDAKETLKSLSWPKDTLVLPHLIVFIGHVVPGIEPWMLLPFLSEPFSDLLGLSKNWLILRLPHYQLQSSTYFLVQTGMRNLLIKSGFTYLQLFLQPGNVRKICIKFISSYKFLTSLTMLLF